MAPTYHIACIGGGTGLFTILSGLKGSLPDAQLSAIVTMMDSGGSTGRLRDEFGHLPPGDIRKCLVALSNAPHRLRLLMDYRFIVGEGLKGHSLGNLMLTAMKERISGGREEKEFGAIQAMGDILNIQGNVFPVTLTDCHLVAELVDGTLIKGETNIDVPTDARSRIKQLYLEPTAQLFTKTRDAILAADTIIIGPGDLFTSIMPNLAVGGMPTTLAAAQENGSKIIYVVNTMTKHGETDEFTARDFVQAVEDAIAPAKLDAVVINDGKILEEQRTAYARERAFPVVDDLKDAHTITRADLVNRRTYARHEPQKLAIGIKETMQRLEATHVRDHSIQR